MRVLSGLATLLVVFGCVTTAQEARRRCTELGLQPKTPEFSACARDLAGRQRDKNRFESERQLYSEIEECSEIHESERAIENCRDDAIRRAMHRDARAFDTELRRDAARIEEMRHIRSVSRPTPPSYQPPRPAAQTAECTSDYDCGVGRRCVKRRFSSDGFCATAVNEHGVPVYPPPRTDSIGPRINISCEFDHQCAVGFRCVSNSCVK